MEVLTGIQYALILLSALWTAFILYHLQQNCRQSCDTSMIKKCVATYVFGLALIILLYLAHRWVLLG